MFTSTPYSSPPCCSRTVGTGPCFTISPVHVSFLLPPLLDSYPISIDLCRVRHGLVVCRCLVALLVNESINLHVELTKRYSQLRWHAHIQLQTRAMSNTPSRGQTLLPHTLRTQRIQQSNTTRPQSNTTSSDSSTHENTTVRALNSSSRSLALSIGPHYQAALQTNDEHRRIQAELAEVEARHDRTRTKLHVTSLHWWDEVR